MPVVFQKRIGSSSVRTLLSPAADRSIQGDSVEGERTVTANMTGIVRDVLVAPGDAVTVGQTLFILEAMKMENEVKAQVDGTVGRVVVEPGVTVSIGDLVLEIE